MRFRTEDFFDQAGARWKSINQTSLIYYRTKAEDSKISEWIDGPGAVAEAMLSASVATALTHWASAFRNTVRNPAIGLAQSLPLGAYEKTLTWAQESYSLITDPDQLASFVVRNQGLPTASLLKESFDGISMIDWPQLISMLGDTAWGQCVSGLGQAVPFVGRAVQGWMAAVSFIDELQRAETSERKKALTSIASGQQAIGEQGSESLFRLDQIFSERVRQKCGMKVPDQPSVTQQTLEDFARGGDARQNLTRAFLPGPIPGAGASESYFAGHKTKVAMEQQGRSPGQIASEIQALQGQSTLILGLEDYTEDEDRMRVLSTRMGGWDKAQGFGYVPGLEKIVGLEQIEQLGNRPARTRDLGDALSGTLSLLNQLESLVTAGPPWCYLVDTVAVREAWRDAVEGYIELRKALYAESRTGGDRRYPRFFQDGGDVRIADHDPGWWMTVSEVTRIVKLPGGNSEVRRVLMCGPKMLTSFRNTENLPYNVGPAAMSSPAVLGPLDYYADWARYDLAHGQNIDDMHPAARVAIDAYGDGQVGNLRFSEDRVFEARRGDNAVQAECKGPNRFSGPTRKYRTRLSPFETEARYPCQQFLQYRYAGNTVSGEPFGWGDWDPNRAWPVPFGSPMVWTDHAGQMSARIDGKPTQVITGNILDMVIEPWCDRLYKMQMQHLDTLWCAYVHPAYPAFENSPVLRLLLGGRRNQLLDSPSRFAVHAPDVIDNVGPGSYAERLENRGVCFGSGKFGNSCAIANVPVNPDGPDLTVMTFVPPSQPEPEPEPLPEPVPPGGTENPSQPDVRLSTEPAKSKSKLPLVLAASALAATAYKAAKS